MDVSFVIDQLEKWNREEEHPLFGKVDPYFGQGKRQVPHCPQFSSTATSIAVKLLPNFSRVRSMTRSAMTRAICSAVVLITGRIMQSSLGNTQRRSRNVAVVSLSSPVTLISA